jgi:Zn-dependent peptidase ImmA (M78 family)/predicted secreted protein
MAARQHQFLGTDLSQRVDVFSIIERAGIWLMFQPLTGLFGAYFREGDNIGIIINSKHPPSLQRFTAAHEYGHHILGHSPSLDSAEQIAPTKRTYRLTEVAAQTFAAHFLMPLQVVNTTLRKLGVPPTPERLTPRQAYLLSLELGVSYAATVNHLAALHKISSTAAYQLSRQLPREIKAEIGGGIRPQNPWADTWPLAENEAGREIYPRLDDELHIELPETPSTGHVWVIPDSQVVDLRAGATQSEVERKAVLGLLEDRFEPRSLDDQGQMRFGGGGVRHLVLRVLQPGHHTLRLLKRMPWQETVEPTETFEVHLNVSRRPTGDTQQGLSEVQKSALAA